MTTPPFIIVADRGGLKAFATEQTPAHGRAARLVEAFDVADAHGRFQDKFSDQAGAFPSNAAQGQANSIAERQGIRAEIETRIFRQLAQRITSILREHQPARWAFAAASEINGAIIDGLSGDLHARLAQNVKRDLLKTDPAKLLAHFEPE